jgi:hypothetical protein
MSARCIDQAGPVVKVPLDISSRMLVVLLEAGANIFLPRFRIELSGSAFPLFEGVLPKLPIIYRYWPTCW